MNARVIVMAMALAAMASGVRGETGPATSLTDSVITRLQADPTNRVLLAELKQEIASGTNREVKCRLGVIYCLGVLAAGDTNEALKVRSQLFRSFAGRPEIGAVGDEAITVPCTNCEKGKVKVQCPKCAGTSNCTYCKATGTKTVQRVGGTEEIKCPQCRGTRRCAECAGTGKVDGPCPECRGYCVVIAPDKVTAGYATALGILKAVP